MGKHTYIFSYPAHKHKFLKDLKAQGIPVRGVVGRFGYNVEWDDSVPSLQQVMIQNKITEIESRGER